MWYHQVINIKSLNCPNKTNTAFAAVHNFLEVAVEVNFPISSENKDMIESLKQDDIIVKAMRTSKVC